MEKLDLSVIILTYNEELHIRRCIENVLPIAKEIFIIDSFSTDATLAIAGEYSRVHVLQNKWENNHAKQFNWGLDHAPITTKWVLRLDADEYLLPELKDELCEKLPSLPGNYTGVVFPLLRVFLGRPIRKGGMGGIKMLRLFQFGVGKSEIRLMDEHIQLQYGDIIEFDNAFADDNLNNIIWWTQKHIGYAIREAVDLLDIEYNLTGAALSDDTKEISEQARQKRMKKHRYARMPLFWRSFMYFVLRYIFKGGFLEGREGFLWHFLQGWWYRTLVDAKVLEIKRACGDDRDKIIAYLKANYNIVL